MDLTLLNWFKDAGIGILAVYVMGRVFYALAEGAILYWKGLREDNKERNAQFAKLLGMSAGEMELTRKAIEHMTRSQRSLGSEVTGLGERLMEGETHLQLHLEQITREAVADLSEKLDHNQNHIVQEVARALDKLDKLGDQLADTKVDILEALEKVVQDKLGRSQASAATEMTVEVSSPSQN
jgi:hypothetical protein